MLDIFFNCFDSLLGHNMSQIDIDKPLWDLKTFTGRFMHFLWVTDPRTCFTPEEELHKAKELVLKVR